MGAQRIARRRVGAQEQAAPRRRAYGHVPADEEGEASEHLLLRGAAGAVDPGQDSADAVRQLVAVHHAPMVAGGSAADNG
ncbi:hypothetical protein SAT01_34460 [Sinomonas atrocyanea]|nr:hypothetical protein SAT01_34460 [Sinomonas atrocyanea]